MAQGRLQKVIAAYRSQLLNHEATATHALNQAHAHTIAAIQPKLDHIYNQIAEKQANGEEVPPHYLYEANRLNATKALISNQVNHYGALAQTATHQAQKTGADLGQESALSMLRATVPVGISYSFGIPHPSAIANLVGALQDGSPLASLFAGFGQEAASKVGAALVTGLSLGDNPRKVAASVQDALDISRQRALVISRNEMLRSYRTSNILTMRANSTIVPQYRWTCDLSDRTCAACLAMDGTLHDVDADMNSHVQCRCSAAPITRSWSDILGIDGLDDASPDFQSGEDWFDEQDASVQQTILGQAKYEAFKRGDFTLKDMVAHTHDANWGSGIREKSLKELGNNERD